MKVQIELYTWQELIRNSWSGAVDTLREIEEQGREEEALDLLEELFNPDVYGEVPTATAVNDFIRFEMPYTMNLYGDSDKDD